MGVSEGRGKRWEERGNGKEGREGGGDELP